MGLSDSDSDAEVPTHDRLAALRSVEGEEQSRAPSPHTQVVARLTRARGLFGEVAREPAAELDRHGGAANGDPFVRPRKPGTSVHPNVRLLDPAAQAAAASLMAGVHDESDDRDLEDYFRLRREAEARGAPPSAADAEASRRIRRGEIDRSTGDGSFGRQMIAAVEAGTMPGQPRRGPVDASGSTVGGIHVGAASTGAPWRDVSGADTSAWNAPSTSVLRDPPAPRGVARGSTSTPSWLDGSGAEHPPRAWHTHSASAGRVSSDGRTDVGHYGGTGESASVEAYATPGAHTYDMPSVRRGGDKICVYVRCRPPLPDEDALDSSEVAPAVEIHEGTRSVLVRAPGGAMPERFAFDGVFGPETSQAAVYETAIRPLISSFLQGFNCCVLAHGQTSSGKTYTMTGPGSIDQSGIIPRAIHDLFGRLERLPGGPVSVQVSFLEIHNENLRDLFRGAIAGGRQRTASPPRARRPPRFTRTGSPGRPRASPARMTDSDGGNQPTSAGTPSGRHAASHGTDLYLTDDAVRGVVCQNLTEVRVGNATDLFELLSLAEGRRRRAHTSMNKDSNRAHSIFTISARLRRGPEDDDRVATFVFADLAGSESAGRGGPYAPHGGASEGGNINKSVLALGRVIRALAQRDRRVPHRASKLTRILSEPLGGLCKTAIIATVAPVRRYLFETLNTLQTAADAMCAYNARQSTLQSVFDDLQAENRELKALVSSGGAAGATVLHIHEAAPSSDGSELTAARRGRHSLPLWNSGMERGGLDASATGNSEELEAWKHAQETHRAQERERLWTLLSLDATLRRRERVKMQRGFWEWKAWVGMLAVRRIATRGEFFHLLVHHMQRVRNARLWTAVNIWRRRLIEVAAYEHALRDSHELAGRQLTALQATTIIDHVLRRAESASIWRRFSRWVSFTRTLALHEARDRRAHNAATKYRIVALRRVLVAWRNHTADCLRRRGSAEQLARRWMMMRQSTAFRGWRLRAVQRREQRARLQRCVLRMQNARKSAAVRSWLSFMARRRAARACIARVFAAVAGRAVAKAFVSWRLFLVSQDADLAAQRHLEAKVLADGQARVMRERRGANALIRWRRRTQAHVFSGWQHFVVSRRVARESAERMARHWRMRSLSAAFIGLRNRATRLRSQRLKLQTFLVRCSHHRVVGCLRSWEAFTAASKRRRALLSRVLRRNEKRAVFPAFSGWKESTAICRTQEANAGRNQLLKDKLEGEQAMRRKRVANVILRADIQVKRRVFNSWSAHVGELKLLYAAGSRLVRHWRQRDVARMFRAWSETAAYRRRTRLTLERHIRRMKAAKHAAAFHGWVDVVRKRRAAAVLVMQAIKRAVLQDVAKCFLTWTSVVHHCRVAELNVAHLSEREAAAQAEAEMRRRRGENAARRWRGALMARCLAAWRESMEEAKRKRLGVSRVVAKWTRASASRAFAGWRDVARSRRHKRLLVGRFVRRMELAHGAAALRGWHAAATHLVRARALLARVLARAARREITRGLVTWQLAARAHAIAGAEAEQLSQLRIVEEQRARADEMLRERRAANAIARWKLGVISHAFSGWVGIVTTLRARRAVAAKSAALWRHRHTSAAFTAWRDNVERSRRHRGVVARFLKKMRHARLFAVVRAWHEFMDRRSRARQLVLLVINRGCQRQMSRALLSWQGFIHAQALGQAEAQRLVLVANAEAARELELRNLRENRIRHTVARMRMRVLVRCFAAWAAERDLAIRQRVWADKFRRQWELADCGRAFRGWRAAAVRRRRNRQLLERASRMIRVARAASALRSWRDFVERRGRARAVLTRAIARCEKHSTLRGWSGWRAFVLRKLEHEVSEEARTAVASAVALIDERQREARERRVRNVVARWRFKTLSKVLSAWREAHAEHVAEAQSYEYVLSRWHLMGVARAFRAWRDQCRRKRRNRVIVSRFAAKLRNTALASSLRAWGSFVERRGHARAVLMRIFRNVQHRDFVRGFGAWRHTTDALARMERDSMHAAAVAAAAAQASRVAASLQEKTALQLQQAASRGLLRRVLTSWRVATQRSMHQRDVAERLSRQWQHAATSRAFRAWHENAATLRRNRVAVARSLARISHARASAAFVTWAAATHRRQHARTVMKRIVRAVVKAELSVGFRAWRAFMSLLEQRNAHELTASLLRSTQDAARAAAHNRARNAVARMKMRTVTRVFSSWRSFTVAERRSRAVAARLTKAWRLAGAARALRAWRDAVTLRRHHRAVVARCVRRIRLAAAQRAFASWVDFGERRRQARRLIRRSIKRVTHREISGSFAAWMAATSELARTAEQRARAEELASLEARRVAELSRLRAQRVEYAARRWRLRMVATCFDAWLELLQDAHTQRQSLEHLLAQWTSMRRARSFRTWRDNAQRCVRHRMLIARSAARLRQAAASAAFVSWTEFTGRRTWLRSVMQHTLSRMRNLLLFRGFSWWLTFAKAATAALQIAAQQLSHSRAIAEQRELMSRTVDSRIQHAVTQWKFRIEGMAFRAWAVNARYQRRLRLMSQRLARHWKMRTTAAAFRGWVTSARSRKQQRVKLQRFLVRLRLSHAAASLRAWSSFVHDRKRLRATLKRTLASMIHRQKMHAFHALLQASLEAAQARDRQRHEALIAEVQEQNEEVARRARDSHLRRAMQRWSLAALARSYHAWASYCTAMQRQRDSVRGFVSGWNKMRKVRTFVAWRSAASTERRRRLTVVQFSRRWRMRHALSAFQAWISHILWRRECRSVLHRIIGRAGARDKARAIRAWDKATRASIAAAAAAAAKAELEAIHSAAATEREAAATAAREAARQRATAMLRKWRFEATAKSFRAWRVGVVEQKLSRQAHRRFLAHWRMARVSRCFVEWHRTAVVLKRQRDLVSRFSAKLRLAAAVRAFATWRDVVLQRVHTRRLLRRVTARCAARKLNSGFQTWKDNALRLSVSILRKTAAARDAEREALERDARIRRAENAARRWRFAWVERCFAAWADYLSVMARARETAARLTLSWQKQCISKALRSWREVTATRRYRRVLVARFTNRLRHAAASRALVSWREYATDRAKARRLLRRVMRRYKLGTESRGFSTWVSFCRRASAAQAQQEEAAAATERARERRAQKMLVIEARVATAIGRSSTRALARSFSGWRNVAEQLRRQRIRAGQIARSWRLALVGRLFRTWRAGSTLLRRQRQTLSVFSARIKLSRAAACFRTWAAAVERRLRSRALLSRILGRGRSRVLGMAMRTFVAGVLRLREADRSRELGEVLAKQARAEEAASARRAAAVLRRWRFNTLSRIFDAWMGVWQAAHATRERARLLALQWRRRDVAVSFRVWRDVASRLRFQRLAISRSLHRIQHRCAVRCLRALYQFAAMRVHARRTLQRMSSQWDLRCKVRGMRAWRDYLLKSREQSRLEALAIEAAAANAAREAELAATLEAQRRARAHRLAAAASRWQRRHSVAVLHAWAAAAATRRRGKQAAARFARQLRFQTAAVAFRTWNDNAVAARLLRSRTTKLVQRMKFRCASAALRSWIAAVKMSKQRRRLVRRIVARFVQREVTHSMGVWRSVTLEARAAEVSRRAEMEAAMERRARELADAAAAAAAAEQKRRRAENVMLRWRRRALAQSFCAMCDFVIRSKHNRQIAARMSQRWRNAALFAAFRGWLDAAQKTRTQRIALHRFTMRMKLVVAGAALRTLHLYADTRRRARSLVGVAVARYRNSQLLRGWNGLRNALLHAREAATRQALLADEQARLAIVTRRRDQRIAYMVSRWNGETARKCFHSWVSATRLALGARAQAEKGMRIWRQRNTSLAFLAWRANATLLRRQRGLLARFSARVRLATATRAMVAWQRFTHRRTAARLVMKRVASRVKLRSQALGFSSLREHMYTSMSEEREAEQQALARGVAARAAAELAEREAREAAMCERRAENAAARWRMRITSAAFHGWQSNVQRLRGQRALAARVAANWQIRVTGAAFRGWHEASARRRRNRLVVARFACRIKYARAVSAFALWSTTASYRKHARRLLKRIIARLTSRALATSLSAWQVFCSNSIAAEALAKERAATLQVKAAANARLIEQSKAVDHMKQARVAHVITRWRRRLVAHIFANWTIFAHASIRNRRLLSRATQRLRLARVASVLRRWGDFVGDRRRARTLVRRLVARGTKRELAAGLDVWRQNHQQAVVEARQAAADLRADRIRAQADTARQRAIAAYITRWRSDCTARALRGWAAYVRERHAARAAASKVAQRWRLQTRLKAFLAWREFSSRRVRNRVVVSRCAARLRASRAAASIRAWVHFADRRRQARNVLHRAVQRAEHRQTARAVRSWVAFATWSHAEQQRLQEQRSLAASAVELAQQRRDAALVRATHAAARWQKSRCSRVLLAWRSSTERRKHARRSAARFASSMANALLWRTFARWNRHAAAQRAARATLGRVAARLRNSRAFAMLSVWRQWSRDRVAVRRLLTRIASRQRRQGESRAWMAWRAFVAAHRIAERSLEAEKAQRRRAQELAASRASAAERRASRMIERWGKGAVARCFATLVARTATAKSGRERARVLYLQWRSGLAARAFRAWREATCRRRRIRVAMVRQTLRRRALVSKTAFFKWSSWAHERRHARHLLGRLSVQLRNKCLARGFLAWTVGSYAAASIAAHRLHQSQLQETLKHSQAISKARDERLAAVETELERQRSLANEKEEDLLHAEALLRKGRERESSLKRSVATLAGESKALKLKLRDTDRLREAAQELRDGVDGEVSALRDSVAEAQSRAQTAEELAKSRGAELSRLRERLADSGIDLSKQTVVSRGNLDEYRHETEATIAMLRSSVADAQQQLKERQREAESARAALQSARRRASRDLAASRAAANENAELVEELQARVIEVAEAAEAHQRRADALEARLRDLDKARAATAASAGFEERAHKLRASALEARLASSERSVESELARREEELSETRAALAHAKAEIDALRSRSATTRGMERTTLSADDSDLHELRRQLASERSLRMQQHGAVLELSRALDAFDSGIDNVPSSGSAPLRSLKDAGSRPMRRSVGSPARGPHRSPGLTISQLGR